MPAVVILGASGSIGSTLARSLVASGQHLLLLGRDAEKLRVFSDELNQSFEAIELSNSDALLNTLQRFHEQLGGYCGIVNCIGSLWLKPIQFTSDEDFQRVIQTNLFTSFAAVKAGAKFLKERGGSIVLISSAAAEIGLHHHESIAAAKAGIIGMARSAAASLAAQNIRVNCVSPGMTRTEMTRQIWENPTSEKASQEMHALGRIGEPQNIVSMIQFLLDSNNNWITGHVFGVDGGLAKIQPRRKLTV
ncbi:MAG: SDR family oxidoreductase [Pirellulales bacterium]